MYVPTPQKVNKPKNDNDAYEIMTNGDYFGTLKIDGVYETLVKNENGEVSMLSRTFSKITGERINKIDSVPHIKEWAENNLPNGTILTTEIFIPEKTSKDVVHIIGSKKERAVNLQEQEGLLNIYIHDILSYNNVSFLDKNNMERINILEEVKNKDLNKETCPWIKYVNPVYDNLQDYLKYVFDNNGEGIVFRKKNDLYVPGKRPAGNLVKIKQEDSLDAVIIGFVQPERVYTGKEIESWPYWEDGVPVTKPYKKGWVAGISIGAYDKNNLIVPIGTISSGMTDFWREDMARNPQSYIGKIAEIQCMSVDKEALSVRHGRLVNVRDDKNETDCTIDTIFK